MKSTLQNKMQILEMDVQRKATGATIHKLKNMLQVAQNYCSINDEECFREAEQEVRKVLFRSQSPGYKWRNQRRHKRVEVKRDALLQHGKSIVYGVIRDESKGGCFFEPQVGYVDGIFIKNSKIKNMFDSKDNVELSITGYGKVIKSSVRWTGKSQAHGCEGIGCEFR